MLRPAELETCQTLIMKSSAKTAPVAAAPSSASMWLSGIRRALSSTGAAIMRLSPHTTCHAV